MRSRGDFKWMLFFFFTLLKLKYKYGTDASKPKASMNENKYRICVWNLSFAFCLSLSLVRAPYTHMLVNVFHNRLNTSIKCIKRYTITKLTYRNASIRIYAIESTESKNKHRKSKRTWNLHVYTRQNERKTKLEVAEWATEKIAKQMNKWEHVTRFLLWCAKWMMNGWYGHSMQRERKKNEQTKQQHKWCWTKIYYVVSFDACGEWRAIQYCRFVVDSLYCAVWCGVEKKKTHTTLLKSKASNGKGNDRVHVHGGVRLKEQASNVMIFFSTCNAISLKFHLSVVDSVCRDGKECTNQCLVKYDSLFYSSFTLTCMISLPSRFANVLYAIFYRSFAAG